MTINRVLFLCHPESDWAEMGMFDGLCRLLGEENVVTYPYKPSYYGLIDTAYKLPDGTYGVTAPAEQCVPRRQGPWTRGKILDLIDTFDLIYIASCRAFSLKAARELWPWIKNKLIAICETEDHEDWNQQLVDEFQPWACFKRCLTDDLKNKYPYLDPLPMSACLPSYYNQIDDTQKSLQVFSQLGNTHHIRERLTMRVARWLKKAGMEEQGRIGLIGKSLLGMFENDRYGESSLSYRDYLQTIAHSLITFVVRGWGIEPLRAWEATLFQTCIFWIQTPQWIYPYPFPDESVVYLNENLDNLEDQLAYYIRNPDLAMQKGQASKSHLLQYHTSEKRAQYMLNIVSEI